jgi:tetratricopeptide (TPR) repeat protein
MNHPKPEHQGPTGDGGRPEGRPSESISRQEPVTPEHGQRAASESEEAQSASKDIQSVLHGWDYEPGTINVRKVSGSDGKPKLQMRLDLGLLQMEMNGRPDGRRPHGCESLLEYYEKRLADHHSQHGTDLGFEISSGDCQSLREEAVMYYQRYLSLFVLEEFAGVVRDTGRNLRLLDLCNKFAADEDDRVALEQYRPYITMMHARARASLHFKEKRYKEALREVEKGLSNIRQFFDRYGQPEAYAEANEVKVLRRLARDIRRKLPVDPQRRLQKKLDRAVKDERYEEAARLRDQLATMKGEPEGPRSARG